MPEDYIETNDLTQVATRKVLELDNIVILPTTKTVEIRTIEKSLDADGNIVSQKAGKNFIYMDKEDNPDTPEDESSNDFTLFISKLGLTQALVKQAIREMESR